jgi:small subunit ribosomal protein S4e
MAHTKRMIAPLYWHTGKKTAYWVVTPKGGKHPKARSIPVLAIIRDTLKLAGTAREAKAILGSKTVLVDSKICTDGATGLGLMDTISFTQIGKHYRVLPTEDGLALVEIPAAEAEMKMLRVVGKHTISGGKTQLTFHDGRTMIVPKEDKVKTGASALFNLKEGKVLKFIPLDRRTLVLIFDGVHSGKAYEISELKEGTPYARPTVLFEAGRKSLETLRDYVIAVGIGKPEITLRKEVA